MKYISVPSQVFSLFSPYVFVGKGSGFPLGVDDNYEVVMIPLRRRRGSRGLFIFDDVSVKGAFIYTATQRLVDIGVRFAVVSRSVPIDAISDLPVKAILRGDDVNVDELTKSNTFIISEPTTSLLLDLADAAKIMPVGGYTVLVDFSASMLRGGVSGLLRSGANVWLFTRGEFVGMYPSLLDFIVICATPNKNGTPDWLVKLVDKAKLTWLSDGEGELRALLFRDGRVRGIYLSILEKAVRLYSEFKI